MNVKEIEKAARNAVRQHLKRGEDLPKTVLVFQWTCWFCGRRSKSFTKILYGEQMFFHGGCLGVNGISRAIQLKEQLNAS